MRAVYAAYAAHPGAPPPELDPQTLHSYLSGAFLVDVPSVWAGLPSVALAQIALYLALCVVTIALAPPGLRVMVALLLLASPDNAHRIVNGDFDIWWVAALAGAWATRGRPTLSAALLGLACAIKQTAWLAAPFYLLWVWRTQGWRAAARAAAVAAGVFLAINLPWAVAAPRAWATSLLLPVSLPLLPEGSGLVALFTSGALPHPPHALFPLLEVAVWLGALAWAWRALPRLPLAGLMLPLAPLVVAWRSDARYFLPLAILAAVALTLHLREPRGGAAPPIGRIGRAVDCEKPQRR